MALDMWAATSNVEGGKTTYPVNRGSVGREEREGSYKTKSQRGGEGRTEWNRGEGSGTPS